MAKFSAKERMVASLLAATPGLKKVVKRVYLGLNAAIYRKNYTKKILDSRISEIKTYGTEGESFGGYYDKTSVNSRGDVVFCIPGIPTSKLPSPDVPLKIIVQTSDGKSRVVAETTAYNWQQGARCIWLDDDLLMYNLFNQGEYHSRVFSIKEGKVVMEFDHPVQDAFGKDYFLSINYSRIMALRPDYGYRNRPVLADEEMANLENDGIWKVDFKTGSAELIHPLARISEVSPVDDFDSAQHKVNHLMIRPDGKGFIFIHRWYKGKRRFDRLIYSDFKSLKVLAAEDMVSHLCWVDNKTVFGYLRLNGTNGFNFIDVETGNATPCSQITSLGSGDGHPTAHGNRIVFDTYPDKSRMQTLYMFDRNTAGVTPLLELHNPLRYQGECRCDLHPRFSADGTRVFFDSVFSGRRQLCSIDVSKIGG